MNKLNYILTIQLIGELLLEGLIILYVELIELWQLS